MTESQMDPRVREFLEGLKELMERTGVNLGVGYDRDIWAEWGGIEGLQLAELDCGPKEIQRVLEGQM